MLLVINNPLSENTQRAVPVRPGDRIEFVVWDIGEQGCETKKFSGIYRYCGASESINVDDLLLFTGDYNIEKIDYPNYDSLANVEFDLRSNVQAQAKCSKASSNFAIIMPRSLNFEIDHLAEVKVVIPVQDEVEYTEDQQLIEAMNVRNDEISNAVNNCIGVITQCDQPWDMQIISAVTNSIRSTLNTFNVRVRQSAVVTEENGSRYYEDGAEKKFLVVVTSPNVRDMQIAREEDLESLDKEWVDWSGCEVLVGFVNAKEELEARTMVAYSENLSVGVLRAYAM